VVTSSFESEFMDGTTTEIPEFSIGNQLWFAGRTVYPGSIDLWFTVHNCGGTKVVDRTAFESVPTDYDLEVYRVREIGNNGAILLFERSWETAANDDRQEVAYQVRDVNGGFVKNTTVLNPDLPPPSVEEHHKYDFESALTDNEGKVWVCFEHTQPGPDEYYYSIIGADGNVWKGPILLSDERNFRYCDKDGFIWATESGQFFALNPDDTVAVGPRLSAWVPNQSVGETATIIDDTGYRLYDRWSHQFIEIDVPLGVNPSSVELFDLNLWDNALHTTDPNLMKGDTAVWSHPGQFTGHTTIDVSDVLEQGQNILTMTQSDFMGGQILVTFPYTICANGDINCDGKVNYEDLRILANQWLQVPGAPSADLAPPTLDNLVNFLDFSVLANNWGYEKLEKFYKFNLDSDPGWSTEGEWTFGQPLGGGGSHGNPDPNSGYTGNNVYGVNLNGDYTVAVRGPYYLTAGPFDCNDYHNVCLKFARWLNTDAPAYVVSKIEVSNNGADWSTVWQHTGSSDIADNSWQIMEYDISSVADNQDSVYLRWSYQILSFQAYSYSGWNIDDIELWGAS